MRHSLQVFRIDWPKLSCIWTSGFDEVNVGFTASTGFSICDLGSCSFGGAAFGEIARLGGEDGGVEGGIFSSEKSASSDVGKSKDGRSDEGATERLSSLSLLSITEIRRRLRVLSKPSCCFLLEYVFEYVLSGGLQSQSQCLSRRDSNYLLTW